MSAKYLTVAKGWSEKSDGVRNVLGSADTLTLVRSFSMDYFPYHAL